MKTPTPAVTIAAMSSESAPPPTSRMGLAIAALVLGVLSIFLSFLLVGGLLGVAGIALAMIHLIQRPEQRRGMAISGVVLSLFGVIASVGFGVLYFFVLNDTLSSMMEAGQSQKWVGVESPDFTVTTMDGQTFKLSDFSGRRVIVDYWATWCSPCIDEIPHFNKLRSAIPEDELALVGISSESESTVKEFLLKHDLGYQVAASEDLPSPYSNIIVIPTTFFIDRNGIIQSVLVGYKEYDELKRHATLEDYNGEIKTAPSSAKP